MTAVAEKPASHKYDVAKRILIRTAFLSMLDIRHSTKSEILLDFLN